MDKNKICEAMYALPSGVVVKRRKSLLVPVVLTLVGVALIVLNNLVGDSLGNDLSSSVIFVGGMLAMVGVVLILLRVLGASGVPFHRDGRSYLRYDELTFERGIRSDVLACVNGGAIDDLLKIPRSQVPSVTVALYRTPDNRFAAMQAFEYADLEYKPLSELKIIGA